MHAKMEEITTEDFKRAYSAVGNVLSTSAPVKPVASHSFVYAAAPQDDDKCVDIIVSEWMGYGLLFESMLPSVIDARDRLMAPGGTMFPNEATMYIEGWADSSEPGPAARLAWWKNVHGVDLSCISNLTLNEASIEVVNPAHIPTSRHQLVAFDLNTVTKEELDYQSEFTLTWAKDAPLHGFVVAFDVAFTFGCDNPVTLGTGANSTPTHWKQTLLVLDAEQAPKQVVKEGDIVTGTFAMHRSKDNPRSYDLGLTWAVKFQDGTSASGAQKYDLHA